jgi:hypothetical protein
MEILQTRERVRVKIGDIALILAPLKHAQKIELSKATTVKDGETVADLNQMLSLAVRHSVKGVEGVKSRSGEDIKLEFDLNGSLSDDSHTDMMVVVTGAKIFMDSILKVAANRVPEDKTLTNETTGEKIEGVEVTVLPKA